MVAGCRQCCLDKGAAVTVTDNAGTAPDGTATADLVSSTATGQGTLQSFVCLGSTVYTVCLVSSRPRPATPRPICCFGTWAASVAITFRSTRSPEASYQTAGVTASGVVAAGSGWYRFWMTYTTEAGQTGIGLQPRLNQTPAPSLGGTSGACRSKRGAVLTDYAPTTVAQVDKTANATTQVNAFFGSVAASDLSVSVNCLDQRRDRELFGPAEWSFRRFILHYAKLCAAINTVDAGAVDAFLIGSELKGLTSIRDNASAFPAVSKLKTLAADVKAILGGATKVGYAADWSRVRQLRTGRRHGRSLLQPRSAVVRQQRRFRRRRSLRPAQRLARRHQSSGRGDSIPRSMTRPISRPTSKAANTSTGTMRVSAARDTQVRTTISDGAYGKPWVYRAKDVRNWWLNQHY